MSIPAVVLTGIGALVVTALYTAWSNGVFLRCPYCGKIGSWRYDDAGPLVEEKDPDGIVHSSTQVRTCRKCRNKVLEKWSDCGGCSFEKHPDGMITE
jgi:hypothetical protein